MTQRRFDLALMRINELDRLGEIIDDWSQTLQGGTQEAVSGNSPQRAKYLQKIRDS